MSIRNLEAVFRPRSVALIGASKRAHSVGAVVARNLLAAGFRRAGDAGQPASTRRSTAMLAYPDVASLPVAPDLAVICTPPDTVPGLVAELGARGTRGRGRDHRRLRRAGRRAGTALEQAMLEAARPHLLRIVGPNCVGLMVPAIGLNASFAPSRRPSAATLAFVTQSGAMVTAVLDWAAARGIGFSHLVSLGDMADVDFGDMLDYLASDPDTRAILLYVEAVTHARKFMSAARAAARIKPVIVIKAGRHAAAARGRRLAHRRAGRRRRGLRRRVPARRHAARPRPGRAVRRGRDAGGAHRRSAGERLAILTNGGGVGVLATDALIDRGGRLAELSPETLGAARCGAAADLVARQPGRHHRRRAGRALCRRARGAARRRRRRDAVLVLNCPTAIASSVEAARRGDGDAATASASARADRAGWARRGARGARAVRAASASRPTRRRTRRCAASCIWCAIGATRMR